MKVIIAGSRGISDYSVVELAIQKSGFKPTCIISGTAAGVDKMGERYAEEHKIKLMLYPADWYRHGKAAGYIRNTEMANNAEALVAVWDGKSKGTKHMIDIATRKELKVFVMFHKDDVDISSESGAAYA